MRHDGRTHLSSIDQSAIQRRVTRKVDHLREVNRWGDLVRDAIFKILKPLQSWNNISRKEAERIEDDVAESVSFAF